MSSYRLIDELPGAKKRQPPYSPLALFILSWLFLPFSIPFWVINWGRLGQPRRRLATAIVGCAVLVADILWLSLDTDAQRTGNAIMVGQFLYALVLLNTQRPLYQSHLFRSGSKPATWPLWTASAMGIAIQVALFWFVSFK